MAVTLVFLGKLADVAAAPDRMVQGPLDWRSLQSMLEPELGAAIAPDKIRIAVNGAILADKALLTAQDGDEIAFLPPVSGG